MSAVGGHKEGEKKEGKEVEEARRRRLQKKRIKRLNLQEVWIPLSLPHGSHHYCAIAFNTCCSSLSFVIIGSVFLSLVVVLGC